MTDERDLELGPEHFQAVQAMITATISGQLQHDQDMRDAIADPVHELSKAQLALVFIGITVNLLQKLANAERKPVQEVWERIALEYAKEGQHDE